MARQLGLSGVQATATTARLQHADGQVHVSTSRGTSRCVILNSRTSSDSSSRAHLLDFVTYAYIPAPVLPSCALDRSIPTAFVVCAPLPSTRMCASHRRYGGNKWTLEETRVPDESKEGIASAVAEREARQRMSKLKWDTKLPNITQPCEAHGAYTGVKLVESDTSGVRTREAALLLRTHMFRVEQARHYTVTRRK